MIEKWEDRLKGTIVAGMDMQYQVMAKAMCEEIFELRNAQDKVEELLHAVGKYAREVGDSWRLHEGLEIMEAYSALVEED